MEIKIKAVFDNAERHEPSAFKRGKSMSEQLREEREYVEKTAVKRGIERPKKEKRLKVMHQGKYAMITRQCNIDIMNFLESYTKPRKLTWSVLARLANAKGLRTLNGKEWTSTNLQQIIVRMKDAL